VDAAQVVLSARDPLSLRSRVHAGQGKVGEGPPFGGSLLLHATEAFVRAFACSAAYSMASASACCMAAELLSLSYCRAWSIPLLALQVLVEIQDMGTVGS